MNRNVLILLVTLTLAAVAWAFTLQFTGQPKEAEKFVEYAGSGLAFLGVLAWLFTSERES